MMLLIATIFTCLWMRTPAQLNLYETDRSTARRSLQFDCLSYRVREEKLAYQDLSNVIDELIPYCFRPLSHSEIPSLDFFVLHDPSMTFDELRLGNITSQHLLSWSAPLDLVETYQLYLNELDSSLSDMLFYNCTQPWFGLRCQYSFGSPTFDDFVRSEFAQKTSSADVSHLATRLPCYVHIRCDRGGPSLCLDWREICDGRVDCLDGGLDEASCWPMELNQCGEDEYRCHNGLCIPRELWEDGMNEAECLDRSDEVASVPYLQSCFQDPTFRCEEHTCRANWHEFSCGDGQCVQTFDACQSGRHALLIESTAMRGDLPEPCWIAMSCLTMLVHEVKGQSCQGWLEKDDVTVEYLRTCPSLLPFPTRPVYAGHIRFLYDNPTGKYNITSPMHPTYICFDAQLCDCLTPTFVFENLTCLAANQLALEPTISGHPWVDIILRVNELFSSCSIRPFHDTNDSTLYSCQNSSKVISRARLVDEIKDCCMGDDETYPFSCALDDPYRVQCPSSCLSSLHSRDDCPDNEYEDRTNIPFYVLCDGIEEYTFDESDCQHWPCDNLYSRCDGYWTCPDGRDEDQCSNSVCPFGTHPCLLPNNYTLICLVAERVNDGTIDCLGASDEPSYCREMYPGRADYDRFRCAQSDLCLSVFDLCDGVRTCPLSDDEDFCTHRRPVCDEAMSDNSSLIAHVLCQWSEVKRRRNIHFSVHTSLDFPRSDALIADQTFPQTEEESSPLEVSAIGSRLSSCYRGLPVRVRLEDNRIDFGCLCPPSYYGAQCEYQNERISLTLTVVPVAMHHVYTVIILLIDADDQHREIHAHEQVDYTPGRSCGMKLNRYLLYPTRPKHPSTNYTLHLDVYEKTSMTYRGSWYLPIPFLFLPVNRLAASLRIPSETPSVSSLCPTACEHGECQQYTNTREPFCRCFSGWSGVACDRPIHCDHCATDSICVGAMNNRSICVCPVTRFGSRCLLTSSCSLNACENGGQCIPADISVPGSDYTCLCPEEFFGARCQYRKATLDVSLVNVDIPPYLMAFFFTVSNLSDPSMTIVLQRLTLFQRTVTFRISVPYHFAVIEANGQFYLAAIQQTAKTDLSTSVHSSRECPSIGTILNVTLMNLPRFQRVKLYHLACHDHPLLPCFLDETYLCLCTAERHANCMLFTRDQDLQCSSPTHCRNDARCLQDHPKCPSAIICVCPDCFFGSRCQFYAKGFGLTLDEILGYEIQRHTSLLDQPFAVKLSAVMTMVMCTGGLLNGIFSIMTFRNRIAQEVGCGMYLLTSSITSLLTVLFFTAKFWFLVLSSVHRSLLVANCMFIEPTVKALVYIDNWLNACVAAERALAVFHGIYFSKKKSKSVAKWVIAMLFAINGMLLLPQLSFLHLFDDEKEQRSWCVVHYSSPLHTYNSLLIFAHTLIPFAINVSSACFIIIATARQRVVTQSKRMYLKQLRNKFRQHKHLLISPIILIVLSLPRLIISFTLDCKKSSRHFWLYLLGYFISFLPSTLIFVIFVLPSAVFRKAFRQALLGDRRPALIKLI